VNSLNFQVAFCLILAASAAFGAEESKKTEKRGIYSGLGYGYGGIGSIGHGSHYSGIGYPSYSSGYHGLGGLGGGYYGHGLSAPYVSHSYASHVPIASIGHYPSYYSSGYHGGFDSHSHGYYH
jgi:hypothetical protein